MYLSFVATLYYAININLLIQHVGVISRSNRAEFQSSRLIGVFLARVTKLKRQNLPKYMHMEFSYHSTSRTAS